jgi:signal transduction histidine kinase
METPEPFVIEADPSLLEQALVNLLLNARQAISREGKISIRATDRADGFSHILIADNGNGILPGDLTNVFSPFFTKRKGGTGLGLSITQKIVEAHGGDVVIESRVQKGTMVIIRIPRGPRVPNEQGLCL